MFATRSDTLIEAAARQGMHAPYWSCQTPGAATALISHHEWPLAMHVVEVHRTAAGCTERLCGKLQSSIDNMAAQLPSMAGSHTTMLEAADGILA